MPPSSRKRTKGKDRKAKQLAKKEESERTDAPEYGVVDYAIQVLDVIMVVMWQYQTIIPFLVSWINLS